MREKIFRKPWLILVLVAIILTVVWFNDRVFLAAGEESFFLWNPALAFKTHQFPWLPLVGPGMRVAGFYLPRLTFIGLASVFDNLGLPVWLIQAVSFGSLLTSGVLGVYFFTKEILNRSSIKWKWVPIWASLFYLLNLYSQSQIWGRFIYNGFFTWTLLPWALLLFYKWAREGAIKWILIFLIISTLLSHAFGNPAFIFTIWAPVGLLFFVELFKSIRNKRRLGRVLVRTFIFVTGWVIVNIWWLYPEIKLSPDLFLSISNWKANFDSLRGVSPYFPTKEILLLKQGYFFSKESPWYGFYSQIWVYAVGLGIFLIAFWGWLKSRKEKNWSYLTLLAIVGWFISKGTNPPLGYDFFKWLFSAFPFTAVLRNSYEKFGVVWLLPYAVFFGLGVGWIYKKLELKIRGVVVGVILFLSYGVLVWPMWSGDLYQEAKVFVPDYYRQVDELLEKDENDGRILVLPMIAGDGIKYTWGYQGIEPSEFLFGKATVSKILRANYFDDKYLDLYSRFINGDEYNSLLEEMNIKYLVLHHDIDVEVSNIISPERTKDILKKNPEITFLKRIGELEIYRFKADEVGSLFEIRDNGSNLAKVTYRKLSPTKYEVQIGGARQPLDLIFKATFNKFWEARIDGKEMSKHFLVYNYANGWRINRVGDYSVDVVFKIWPWE